MVRTVHRSQRRSGKVEIASHYPSSPESDVKNTLPHVENAQMAPSTGFRKKDQRRIPE
jgi:hypothetical protein